MVSTVSAVVLAYVTNQWNGTVSVIDTATNAVIATIPVSGTPIGITINPDKTEAYVTNRAFGTISVIDLLANTVVATIPVESFPERVAFTPDGHFAYATNGLSNSVSVIDTATRSVTTTIHLSGVTPGGQSLTEGIAISPDGARAYVAIQASGVVSIIDIATNTVSATVPVPGAPLEVLVSPDGAFVYLTAECGGLYGCVDVLDPATYATTHRILVGLRPQGIDLGEAMVLSRRSKVAYVSASYSWNVWVVDLDSYSVVTTIPVGAEPVGVAITPDEDRVYVANLGSNTISVIDTATNTVQATLPGSGGPTFIAIACVGVCCQPCMASDQCHVAGSCDPTTGACSNPTAPDGTACDDNDACTRTDNCHMGTCVGGDPVVCASLDQCHVAGTCDPTTGACSNPAAPDGTICDDRNACTQTDQCDGAGQCVGSNAVMCTPLDQCHDAGVCDPETGLCSEPTRPDSSPCDDGDECTRTDVCDQGVCVGGNLSWSGVLQPVNADGSSVFKLGQTIPVKFRLTGACMDITDLVAKIYVAQLIGSVVGTQIEAVSTAAADDGNTFRYDPVAGQYIFNLATKGLSAGTWQLHILFGDGVDRTLIFSLRP